MGGRPKSVCPGVHAMAVKSTYRNSKGTEGGVFTSKLGSYGEEEGLCDA